MTNDTEPFWTKPAHQHTWRDDLETWLTRIGDAYFALWDLMPAIAAIGVLAILIIATPH